MKILVLLIFATLPGFGQANHWIGTTGQVSLSATTTALTVQQPATGGKGAATLDWASFYCSVACTVTEQVNCTTLATTTAGTWVALPGQSTVAPILNYFTASNASSCTTLKVNNVNAGQTFVLLFPFLHLGSGGQYTFAVSSITGTANITVSAAEPQ